MTTENKIPPNWPEALVMADKIAEIATEGVVTFLVEGGDLPKQTAALQLYRRMKEIGTLVGVEWPK